MKNRFDIKIGWEVLDSDGENIGTVHDIMQDYFEVDMGFLGLGENLYIPFDAIADLGDGSIHLKVPKDRTASMGWNEKPPRTGGTGPAGLGTSDTMPR
jgi:hypothetical protein